MSGSTSGPLPLIFLQPGILFPQMAISRSGAEKCKMSLKTPQCTGKLENTQIQMRSCKKDTGTALKGSLLTKNGDNLSIQKLNNCNLF